MILDTLEDLQGKPLHIAIIAYASVQESYVFAHVDGEVCHTPEDAEAWLDRQHEARNVLFSKVRTLPPAEDINAIRERAIHSLRVERQHCAQKMSEELQRYDERIEKLLAITHQQRS